MSKKGNQIAISTSLRLKPIPANHNENKLDNNNAASLFAHILNEKQTQLQCYNATCSHKVDEFINGRRNNTLFVYGQTGSGKTQTLFGPPNSFHSAALDSTNVKFGIQVNSVLISGAPILMKCTGTILQFNAPSLNIQYLQALCNTDRK